MKGRRLEAGIVLSAKLQLWLLQAPCSIQEDALTHLLYLITSYIVAWSEKTSKEFVK